MSLLRLRHARGVTLLVEYFAACGAHSQIVEQSVVDALPGAVDDRRAGNIDHPLDEVKFAQSPHIADSGTNLHCRMNSYPVQGAETSGRPHLDVSMIFRFSDGRFVLAYRQHYGLPHENQIAINHLSHGTVRSHRRTHQYRLGKALLCLRELYIRSTTSIPNRFKPSLIVRAVNSHNSRRLVRSDSVSAFSTGQFSKKSL